MRGTTKSMLSIWVAAILSNCALELVNEAFGHCIPPGVDSFWQGRMAEINHCTCGDMHLHKQLYAFYVYFNLF